MFDFLSAFDDDADLVTMPGVEEVRPCRCPRCGGLAEEHGRIMLEGNGTRRRRVLLPPSEAGDSPRLVMAWVRRYRCRHCGAAPSVMPPGVLPYHLYSLASMLTAWVLAHLQLGGDARAVCASEGADRTSSNPTRSRWRSPSRWAKQIPSWWPGIYSTDPSGLLLDLFTTSGSETLEALAQAAIHRHVIWAGVR